MSLTFDENDFAPIDGYAFQNWGSRLGMPFDVIRPLREDAAGQLWRRVLPLLAVPAVAQLDLAGADDWDRLTVRSWMLEQCPDRELVVYAVYHPQWAVAVDWGTLCDYWLNFLWTEAAVLAGDQSWLLHHDGEHFAIRALDPQARANCGSRSK